MVDTMRCGSCGSGSLSHFPAEISIHFHGLKNIDRPQVMVFPQLLVCLACGIARFAVPETELRLLLKAEAAGGS